MIWFALLLAFTPCPGGEPCDDPAVLNNAHVTARRTPHATFYVTRCGEVEVCHEPVPVCYVAPYITPACNTFTILACNVAGCSPGEVAPVYFLAFTCIEGDCVAPCFDGAPLHYPELPTCSGRARDGM